MADLEFDAAGHSFRAGRLAPRVAAHVGRRLLPVIGSFKDLLPMLADKDANDLDAMAAVAAPMTDAVAKMADADFDYIVDACLAVVRLKVDGERGWAPVASGKDLMFDWITMPVMLQLVWKVISYNLSDFFPAGASASPAGGPVQA